MNILVFGNAPSIVVAYLCGASLTALKKRYGGLRPIAVGEVFQRLTSKCISLSVSPEAVHVLSPLQVGVGNPVGCEAIVHSVTNEYANFIARKNRVLATIVLTVNWTVLYLIGEPDSPVTVWEKLTNHLQEKTWANKLVLRRKLYSLRLKDGESVHEHIKSMTEIFKGRVTCKISKLFYCK